MFFFLVSRSIIGSSNFLACDLVTRNHHEYQDLNMSEPLIEFFVFDSYLGGGGRRDFFSICLPDIFNMETYSQPGEKNKR